MTKIIKPIPNKLRPDEIEPKWQKVWESIGIYCPDIEKARKPYYNLMMFPYPSAEGLHVGNMYAFTGVDIHGRYMRMRGHDVFEPMGLDGFGIHSENYALKVNRHPKEQAVISEQNFYRQLKKIGNGFDWKRSLETYDPDYYKWTQWIFVEMFKHGLAYRDTAEVNWCPSCKTVLADEQVIDEKCERCDTTVIKKELEQWFFRITAYAERLLQNTYKPQFKWTDKVKIGQRNWIGKKEGIIIKYQIITNNPITTNKYQFEIEVFTTAPVNFGMTFLVISPEYNLVTKILDKKIQIPIERYKKVKKYVEDVLRKSAKERKAEGREKTGVFTGLFVVNPINDKAVPVWISDFVVKGVGTGAVQGCPGHDYKDFEFARKFGLPIIRVVVGEDGDMSQIDSKDKVIVSGMKGKMVNSEFLNGLDFSEGLQKTMDYFEEKGWGKRVITYHMRDWLISRQRYWGAPIPMVYCKKCAKERIGWISKTIAENSNHQAPKSKQIQMSNKQISKQFGNWKPASPAGGLEIGNSMRSMVGWFPVPEVELPVLLPDVKDWKPLGTGRGPLAGHPEFYKTTCPHCSSPAERETDVCDTFLDSAWYYLRYPFTDKKDAARKDKNLPWDKEILQKWAPVDSYIGGSEHTVLHLLYTRFMWMALKDWGYIETKNLELRTKNIEFDPDEPFKRFYAHGLIIKDGFKMSKSKGNVVIPDEYIKLYGADTLRTYLMFLGPFDGGGDFRDTGIAGMYRWLSRVWRETNVVISSQFTVHSSQKKSNIEARSVMAKTIKGVTCDIERLHFNTGLAKLMEYMNWWMENKDLINMEQAKQFLLMLAPFAPHMTEELWQRIKDQELRIKGKYHHNNHNPLFMIHDSIHVQPWPGYDPKMIIENEMTIIVQVNGKLRDSIVIKTQDRKQESEIVDMAKKSKNMLKWLNGKNIKKTIYIPDKLINFVI